MYVTPAQMTTYYDSRRLLQLVMDDGTDGQAADLTNTNSAAYRLLQSLIRAVESEIDSALQVGQRYTRADLEQIITDATAGSPTEAQKKRAAILQRLTADLTFGALMVRRAFSAEQIDALCPRYAAAQETLVALADGSRIFDLDGPKAAGVPSSVPLGQNISNTVRNGRLFGLFPTYATLPDGGFFYNG